MDSFLSKNLMKINIKGILCLVASVYFTHCHATSPDIYTFTMKAIVVQPASCTLNNGNDVAVFFGNEVDIANIDGENYKTKIAYNLQCKNLGKNAITMEINGTNADFGAGLLSVQPGLGIQIVSDKMVYPINTPFTIDGNNQPILMAVPIKKAGATLTPGAFETAATIKVMYE